MTQIKNDPRVFKKKAAAKPVEPKPEPKKAAPKPRKPRKAIK